MERVYVYGAIRAFEGQVSVFNYQGGPDYRPLFPIETEMLSMPHPPKEDNGVTRHNRLCQAAESVEDYG